MNRRGFLQSILIAGVAPAIVRAESLMAVRGLLIPAKEIILPGAAGIVAPISSIAIGRVWAVDANSKAYLEAQSEGLIEVRRKIERVWKNGRGHEREIVEFALENPELRYIQKRIY